MLLARINLLDGEDSIIEDEGPIYNISKHQ